MIYKCKNFGQDYYQKPDYCECGNNVFITVNSSYDTNSVISNKNKDDFDKEYKPIDENANNKDNSQTLTVFVILFIIFSIFIPSLFIYKAVIYKPSSDKKVTVNDNANIENIPLVDSYWDNSLSSENSKKSSNDKQVNIENIIFEIKKQSSEIISKNDKEKNKDNINTNSVSKVPIHTDKDLKTHVKRNKEKPAEKVKENVKQSINTSLAETNTNSAINKSNKNNIVSDNESVKNNNTDIQKQAEQEKIEFSNYKANLRLSLFQYFPILNVFGSGIAIIGFNISSDGKLNNRRFIQQSDNKSLNDAVYHMLMCVPVYSPPPKNYKGEDIILKMEFNNGYYSFSFVE